MENNIPVMLSIKETAKRSNLPETFVRKLCLDNKIVYTKTGKKYLINFDRFVDYLNQQNS